MKEKPLAIFDIDGTIFRSSLLIELEETLIEYGIIPKIVQKEIEKAFNAWLDRKGTYEAYLKDVIETYKNRVKGCLESDINKVSKIVIHEQQERVYTYTRDLIKKLKNTHTLVAISGSPKEIVKEFNKNWKFDHIYATEYEIKNKRYTGKLILQPSLNKKTILKQLLKDYGYSLKLSVGVGDTESDISFLKMVENPIAFNPNKALYAKAKKNNWKIIVERKDVVYNI